MTILQHENYPFVITVLTGDDVAAAQYVGFAQKKVRALSTLSRRMGGAPLVQRYDMADATIIVTTVGNYKKIQIDGFGCLISMFSGLFDMRTVPVTPRPPGTITLIPYLDPAHDYTLWGQFGNSPQLYSRLTRLPYVPQVVVAADAQSFSRSATALASAWKQTGHSLGEYLYPKERFAVSVPSSVMTGRMRAAWQAGTGLQFGHRGIQLPYVNDVQLANSRYTVPGDDATLTGCGYNNPRFFVWVPGVYTPPFGPSPSQLRCDSHYPRGMHIHIDSAGNYSLIGRTFSNFGATPLRPPCGLSLSKRLSTVQDPPLTTRQKEILESYFFAETGVYYNRSFGFPFGVNITDGTPNGVLAANFCVTETFTGAQSNAPGGFIFDWVASGAGDPLLQWGGGAKASDNGTYLATCWAHAHGRYFVGGFGLIKLSSGDVTTYEHVFKFVRNPLAGVPTDPLEQQERNKWTVTKSQRFIQSYRCAPSSVPDGEANKVLFRNFNNTRMYGVVNMSFEGVAGFGFFPGQVLEKTFVHNNVRCALRCLAATFGLDPEYLEGLPSGRIPFFIIGFEDDVFYHKLVLDLSGGTPAIRLVRTNAETGAEADLTNAVFPILLFTYTPSMGPAPDPLPLWQPFYPVVPRGNNECIYIYEAPPVEALAPWGPVRRYTPKGGLETVHPGPGPPITGNGIWEHESAYRHKYIGTWGSNVAAYGVAPAPTFPIAATPTEFDFVWAGHE